jgi:protein SCO1
MTHVSCKCLAALALLLSLGACKPAPQAAAARFSAVDITGADYGAQLKLPDTQGQERSLAEFKGKLVYVFFGFTHCPDVCPLTMADLAQVKKELGPDEGARVQGIFITLDPERDTPAALQAYVQGFDPSFIALRGTPEQTQAAARSFKIYYAKVPGKTPESYTLDHTAGSYIFDPKGQLRLFTRYAARDEKPGGLKADMQQLLQGR